jgi:hypothetical protein
MSLGLPLQATLDLCAARRGDTRRAGVPWSTVLLLALPASCDIVATVCLNAGLLYVTASIAQLLRAAMAGFAALLRVPLLSARPSCREWTGLAVVMFAVAISSWAGSMPSSNNNATASLAGVSLLLLSALVQAVQFVLEERILRRGVEPMLVMGIEGCWGIFGTTAVVWPVVYFIGGDDHGSLENVLVSWQLVCHSTQLRALVLTFLALVFVFNVQQMVVNFRLGSVFNSLIASFRIPAVWAGELSLFYLFSDGAMGAKLDLPWGCWIQLAGMTGMLVGTAIFNGAGGSSNRREPVVASSLDERLL